MLVPPARVYQLYRVCLFTLSPVEKNLVVILDRNSQMYKKIAVIQNRITAMHFLEPNLYAICLFYSIILLVLLFLVPLLRYFLYLRYHSSKIL